MECASCELYLCSKWTKWQRGGAARAEARRGSSPSQSDLVWCAGWCASRVGPRASSPDKCAPLKKSVCCAPHVNSFLTRTQTSTAPPQAKQGGGGRVTSIGGEGVFKERGEKSGRSQVSGERRLGAGQTQPPQPVYCTRPLSTLPHHYHNTPLLHHTVPQTLYCIQQLSNLSYQPTTPQNRP